MKLSLSIDERGTCRKALGRAKRVTESAMKAYAKADLATLAADAQLGNIDGALTAIESAGENEEVELVHLHRLAIRFGLRLLTEDVEQTKDREASLGIEIEGSEQRLDELTRLGRRLGEQAELDLTSDMLGLPSSQVGEPAAEAMASNADGDCFVEGR